MDVPEGSEAHVSLLQGPDNILPTCLFLLPRGCRRCGLAVFTSSVSSDVAGSVGVGEMDTSLTCLGGPRAGAAALLVQANRRGERLLPSGFGVASGAEASWRGLGGGGGGHAGWAGKAPRLIALLSLLAERAPLLNALVMP